MSKRYSLALQLAVAQANRKIKAARQRQSRDDASNAERVALGYAEKEIQRIFGKNAEKFTLKGATDQQIRQVEDAVERVNQSRNLTMTGRKAVQREALEGFFQKDYEDIDRHEKMIFDFLTEKDEGGRLIDKAKEQGLFYAVKDAAQMAPGMSPEHSKEFLTNYINNIDNAQEVSPYDYIREKYAQYFTD